MSYNPLSELNRQRLDVLDVLRRDVEVWLSAPSAIKRTQSLLAQRAGISNQMLSDVLAGSRGLKADTYDRLIVALKSSGATITNYSTMGRVFDGDLQLSPEEMETFNQEYTEQHLELARESVRNSRKGSMFEIPRTNKKEFSK